MKKSLLLLLTTLLLVFVVSAEPADVNQAYSWLISQTVSDVFTASVAALAVQQADETQITPYLDLIQTKKHSSEECWPSPSCNVKDTSIVLVLSTIVNVPDTTTDDIETWLIEQQELAGLSGDWLLQIISIGSGTCELVYTKQGLAPSTPISLEVDQGKITHGICQEQTFFNIGTCISSSILSTPSTLLEISCPSDIGAEISLLFREHRPQGDIIYLITEAIQDSATIYINNGKFGNKESTLYANWALREANSNINSELWLRRNTGTDDVFDQSLLSLSTIRQIYLSNLLQRQSATQGYFFDSGQQPIEFENGLAALALRTSGDGVAQAALGPLRNWLGDQQRSDGSWSNNKLTTAMILYGAYEGGSILYCSDGLIDGDEECDDGNTNSSDGCSSSCVVEQGWTCSGTPSVCTTECGDGLPRGDEECDDGNLNAGDGCSASCLTEPGWSCIGEPSICHPSCGDGIIDTGEECDDENIEDADGCSASCLIEPGWNCTGEPSICTSTCGNGIIDTGEECDDENIEDADGCSASCLIEPGWLCDGEPSICIEDCELINPRWLNEAGQTITSAIGNEDSIDREPGDQILLYVTGTYCQNKHTFFDIYEDEGEFLEDPLEKTVGPVEVGGVVTWRPPWYDDDPAPETEDNPEFYFKARLQEDSELISEKSPLLHVSRPPFIEHPLCPDGIPNWTCDTWTFCEDDFGIQTRNCDDLKACGIECGGDPDCIEERDCIACTPNWQCTDWSACSEDGIQIRDCRDENLCNKACPSDDTSCAEARDCFVSEDGNESDYEPPPEGEDTGDEEGEDEEDQLICVINGMCETEFGEDETNCPEDCSIVDTDTDLPDITPPIDTTPDDFTPTDEDYTEEEGRSLAWIFIILILLIIIIVASYFFIFKKGGLKTKRKQPPPLGMPPPPPTKRAALLRQPQQPEVAQTKTRKKRETKSAIEKELEKSLKEAKKLIEK